MNINVLHQKDKNTGGQPMQTQTQSNPFNPIRERSVFGDFDPWADVQLKSKAEPLPEPQDGVFPEALYAVATIDKLSCSTMLWVTNSRLIFHGSTSTRSSSVGTMNTAEGDKAGLVSCGHIRYEWLTGISYRLGSLPMSNEIELRWSDEAGISYTVSFYFAARKKYAPTTVDVLANKILGNVCRHRLSMTDTKSEDALAFYQKHALTPQIPKNADPKDWSAIEIPCAYPAPGGREFSPEVVAAPAPAPSPEVIVAQQKQQTEFALNELIEARKKAKSKTVINILLGMGLIFFSIICFIAGSIGTGVVFTIVGVIDLLYGFTLKGKAKDWDARIQQMERPN